MRSRGIATSDWHIRVTTPFYRKDKSYLDAQFDKAEQVFKLCVKHEADLYHAGDLFDSANTPKWLYNRYLELFRNYKGLGVTVYGCAGQHDQHFHSLDLSNAAIGSFYSSGLILRGNEIAATQDWGGEPSSQGKKVLVLHKCVTPAKNELIKDSISSTELIRSHDYRVIISGDYHVPHTKELDGRTLLNPGSLMRQNKDQRKHKPQVFLIDFDTFEYKKICLQVRDPEEVFDYQLIESDVDSATNREVMENRLNKYLDNVGKVAVKRNFPKILQKVVEDTVNEEPVRKEISDVMEKCQC